MGAAEGEKERRSEREMRGKKEGRCKREQRQERETVRARDERHGSVREGASEKRKGRREGVRVGCDPGGVRVSVRVGAFLRAGIFPEPRPTPQLTRMG